MLTTCILSQQVKCFKRFNVRQKAINCHLSLFFKRSVGTRPPLKKSQKQGSGVGKWLSLIFPMSGIMLGIWQVQRKQWKLGVIANLDEKTKSKPIPFPSNLKELDDLEYRPLSVTGAFDHSKEIYVQPRHLIESDATKQQDSGSILSMKNNNIGMQVITPFFVPGLGITIMVNRGFVPRDKQDPNTRVKGQVQGLVQLNGILRHTEKRPTLVPKNNVSKGQFNYKDLNEMAGLLGASPILLDAIETVPDGPIGGQTKVSMRDEHIQYAITWFSLAAITSVMWYLRFIK